MADRRTVVLVPAAFRGGEADSFEVLEQHAEYVEARLRVLAAAADYSGSLAELGRARGVAADP